MGCFFNFALNYELAPIPAVMIALSYSESDTTASVCFTKGPSVKTVPE